MKSIDKNARLIISNTADILVYLRDKYNISALKDSTLSCEMSNFYGIHLKTSHKAIKKAIKDKKISDSLVLNSLIL